MFLGELFSLRGLFNVCIKDTERVSFKSRKDMKKEYFEQNNLDKKA